MRFITFVVLRFAPNAKNLLSFDIETSDTLVVDKYILNNSKIINSYGLGNKGSFFKQKGGELIINNGILKDNCYMVYKDNEKLDKLNESPLKTWRISYYEDEVKKSFTVQAASKEEAEEIKAKLISGEIKVFDTATFTVKSRIYKPVISEREINIKSIADSTVVVRKAISSIFDNSKNTKCKFVNTLNVSENNLFAAEVVNDTLVITVSNYVSGNATIELTQVIKHNTTSYGEKTFTASIPVIVEKTSALATSIALDIVEKEAHIGEEFTLTATVLPTNTTNPAIAWSTSDSTIATVVDGKVVAIGVGEAIITVATTDGSNLTATCRVVVKPILVSIDKVENNFVVTTENKNIVITSTTDNSIVRVFTVTGAHIGDGHIYAGKATIAVPVRGIYVVYVNNKATKVIVK